MHGRGAYARIVAWRDHLHALSARGARCRLCRSHLRLRPVAVGLEAIGMRKVLGSLVAIADVSIKVPAGTVRALSCETGADKSTLVKRVMGFHQSDARQVLVDGREQVIRKPREASEAGIGMSSAI